MTNNNADLVLRHVRLVDPEREAVLDDRRVSIVGGRITEVGPDDGSAVGGAEVDGAGLFALPGLIDCHVHATAVSADFYEMTGMSPAYVAAGSAKILAGMLSRGFTTVRDTGGADWGLAKAVEEGLFEGPRVVYCGKALSQTGGHGDTRPGGREVIDDGAYTPDIGRVCDGVTGVRVAVRDEVRKGASHIKLMLSGGCASPTDRIDGLQFSDEEVKAAVAQAGAAGVYCAGHAYTSDAVARALRLGVRTIEHGNLIDEETARLFAQHDAFYVPTMIAYTALEEEGYKFGVTEDTLVKVKQVRVGALRALELADRAGADIAYGSDLLGGLHYRQSEEFALRAEVQTAAAILRSATTVGARLLRRSGELGEISVGARGDAVLTYQNPLDDIQILAKPQTSIAYVVKDGRITRRPAQ